MVTPLSVKAWTINLFTAYVLWTRLFANHFSVETGTAYFRGGSNFVSLFLFQPWEDLVKTEDVTYLINCILSSNFTTGSTFYINCGEYMS